MKKITKPAQKEESLYYTDFKGYVCPEWGPPVELKINFNYGSAHDGDEIVLHLTDEELKPILELIKENLSEDFKYTLKDKLKKAKQNLQDSIDMRDWYASEYGANSIDLLNYLLNKES